MNFQTPLNRLTAPGGGVTSIPLFPGLGWYRKGREKIKIHTSHALAKVN